MYEGGEANLPTGQIGSSSPFIQKTFQNLAHVRPNQSQLGPIV